MEINFDNQIVLFMFVTNNRKTRTFKIHYTWNVWSHQMLILANTESRNPAVDEHVWFPYLKVLG